MDQLTDQQLVDNAKQLFKEHNLEHTVGDRGAFYFSDRNYPSCTYWATSGIWSIMIMLRDTKVAGHGEGLGKFVEWYERKRIEAPEIDISNFFHMPIKTHIKPPVMESDMKVESKLDVYVLNGVDIRTKVGRPEVLITSASRDNEVVIHVPSDPPTSYAVSSVQLKLAIDNATNISNR